MDELISVIVPVYNVAKYLSSCVESLLNQTYKNLEIILVDDGSTDNSGEMCDQFAIRDSRIKVIHQQNIGLSEARNNGIAVSNGSYISLIDSDDFVHKDFIRILYETLKMQNCEIACTKTYPYIDGNEEKVIAYWRSIEDKKPNATIYDKESIYDLALYQTIKATGAQQKLYKKEIFEKIKFPKNMYYEDIGALPEILFQIKRFAMLDQILYAYRLRKDSIMTENFNQHKMDCIWISDHIESFTQKYMPQKKHLDAAADAGFRVNRVAYSQIPPGFTEERKKVWRQICYFRKRVMLDKRAPKYDRALCILSYLGEGAFGKSLSIFQKLKIRKLQ